MRCLVGFALLLLTAAALAAPSNCRLYLASQYDWGAKAGFYLDLEGGELASLPLILGVADGTEWRFTHHPAGFVTGRDYVVKAVIGPRKSELFLDGAAVGTVDLALRPAPQALMVNDRPPWASDPGDWLCTPTKATVALTREGREVTRRSFDFSAWASRALALQFFERGAPESAPLETRPGDTITAELTIRFARNNPRDFAPLIDRFGQATAAEFPGKVRSDDELRADLAAEDAELAKMRPSSDFDPYGGYRQAGWKEHGSGFYRTLEHGGKWWLITPEGNPCFYTGVCSTPGQTWETTPVTGREFVFEWLPPRDGPFAAAWARNQWGVQDDTEYCCFYTVNLIRKYGEGWSEKAADRALRRMQAWGLQGGKWGCGVPLSRTPVLHHWGVPDLAGHCDVFDPAVRDKLRAVLGEQITPHRRDPRIVGWSFGNEYDELIKRDEIGKILALPPATPARRALIAYALQKLYGGKLPDLCAAWQVQATDAAALQATAPRLPEADAEKLRLFYEARYHECIYQTIKELDPDHLYLGFWIVPGWWESPEDWAATTPYCDVIGYDRYARQFSDERLEGLLAQAGKPVLCGEFSLPSWYEGKRGFGRYGTWSRDEEEAATLYEGWVRDAARNRYCVGLTWFIYHDQPLTGRGPGRGEALVYGEHYAFGLVNDQDRVKWPLVRAVREANLKAPLWRLGRD